MDKYQLQAYLNKEFQGEESFLENIIFPIFNESNYETAYRRSELRDDNLRALALRTGIQEIIKYGTVTIGHLVIDIFEVTVQEYIQMSRNRVTIQQIIRRIMETYSSAFIIFHYKDNWQLDWRFSFCQKDDKNMTEAKRYTFMLGPNQSCKTASENFMKLFGKGDCIKREEIIAAFDVEALSEEFYAKYSGFYADFVEYITGKRIEKIDNEWVEVEKHKPHPQMYADFGENDKAVRDYIKRTLGRIVFLHFLQKKGWMGVEPNKDWGEGDFQFMKHLYECASEEQKDDYLDSVLEPLFDKALDTMPDNELWLFDTKVRSLPNGGVLRFPYLNGGLFERDAYDKIPTRFPRDMFRDFLEFLYQYNFTIDENDPNDAEVGVDPEMLGQIFENLLEDNKFKGAYYTKKEVVQYMAKEALIAYLQTNYQSDENKKNCIRKFVSTYDISELGPIDYSEIKDLLKKIKVCDPAIGSGAYPMGVLREIFRCRLAIEDFSAERYAEVKRYIIQNNIYGVDIEQGAVEIARLRFWLSLVVDEVTPSILPNLDYKILTGNSLLTTFNGQYIDLSKNKNNSSDYLLRQLKANLTEKKNELFLFSGNKKYQWEIDIKTIILDMLELQLVSENKGKADSRMSVGKLFEDNYGVAVVDEHSSHIVISPERQELIDSIKLLRAKLTDDSIGLKERSQIVIPFFDWKLMFSEIFQNGGFDIVLGNPPYISGKNQFKDETLIKQREDIKISKQFKTLHEKWDLYVPFMELALQMLKINGVMTMIVPYPLSDQKYSVKLREMMCKEHQLEQIVDAKGYKLFKNATVENCIPLIRTGGHTISTMIAHYHDDKTFTRDYYVPIDHLIQNQRYIWDMSIPTEKVVIPKYEGMHVLGDFCYITTGMVLNADEKTAKGEFIKDDLISETKDDIHCKEYTEGKDIDRYVINRIRYLEYGTDRCPAKVRRPTFPELYSKPKLLTNKLGKMTVVLDEENLLCDQTNRICVKWVDLKGITNKSIEGSIKKFSTMPRKDMEELSKKIDLYYLLGVLNSEYANTLLNYIRGEGNKDVNPDYIREIKIPLPDNNTQEEIATLVKEVITLKKVDKDSDTSDIESEIDRKVYNLYENDRNNS